MSDKEEILATTFTSAALAPAATREAAAASAGVPWYVSVGVVAVTSATIGGAWDVSWHRSIGRDTFWTPAHLAIYACGVLAGVLCGALILSTTFDRRSALRSTSVSVLGFRAPLGAFIAAWGGIAMLTSAPFDNWWHAAYGLDVKIISPPHTLLILGIRAISVGIVFLTLAAMNRAADAGVLQSSGTEPARQAGGTASLTGHRTFRRLQFLLLYLGGLTVGGQMFFLQEYTFDVKLHQVAAYVALGIAIPVVLATFREASRSDWAATSTTAVYTACIVAEILILPMFAAQPKLGPVFFPVTHFVPAKFPVLILAPAVALDLLWQRTRTWKPWSLALVSGFLFVAVLTAVEWPFATFLLSHASENRFFGTIYFDYNSRPDGLDRLRQFFQPSGGWSLAFGLVLASFFAAASTWIGLRFGRWMRTVER